MKSAKSLLLLSSLLSSFIFNEAKALNPAFTPESILPTGVDATLTTNPYTGESGSARKGTVAAMLNNVALLNTLLTDDTLLQNQKLIRQVSDVIISLLPSLRYIGIFDLFAPDEWLSTTKQPGRVLTILFYLEKYPQHITPEIKQRLTEMQNQTKVSFLSKAITNTLEAKNRQSGQE